MSFRSHMETSFAGLTDVTRLGVDKCEVQCWQGATELCRDVRLAALNVAYG